MYVVELVGKDAAAAILTRVKLAGGSADVLTAVGRFLVEKAMPAKFKSRGEGEWPAVARGGMPLFSSGTLARSFSYSVAGHVVSVRSAEAYAGPHHRGDVVKAKDKFKWLPGGPYLSIPLPSISGNGTKSVTPRDFPGWFPFKSKAGNWLLGRTKGKGKNATLDPLFVLEKSVKLQARSIFKWTASMISGCKTLVLDKVIGK